MLDTPVKTVADIHKVIKPFLDGNFLFRGQTKHHTVPNGLPSLTSSFSREGCIPPLMLKWNFYVEELLRRGGLNTDRPDKLSCIQALLQHYGWRSFYIDLSASHFVSAWFAGNAFRQNSQVDFCEDVEENPVFLIHKSARYEPNNELGHLYVLDKEIMRNDGRELVDLCTQIPADCKTRFNVQHAWLVGTLTKHNQVLDPKSVVAHIHGPAEAFRGLAAEQGFIETSSMFPGPDEDFLYANMRSLPWLAFADIVTMPAYHRMLDIPDYNVKFIKHLSPAITLYSPFWLKDKFPAMKDELHFHVPESAFYGATSLDIPIPYLHKFLTQHQVITFESKNILCYPAQPNSFTYEKGIRVDLQNNDLVSISSITVDHPGHQIDGVGVAKGYHYKINGKSFLERIDNPEDCPCGDPERHAHHLRAVIIFEQLLANEKLKQLDDKIIEVGTLDS